MTKIFTAQAMQALENAACAELGLTLDAMMENAGAAAVRLLRRKDDPEGKRIVILCGKGNNGGDGFVAARLLADLGAVVTVILVSGEPATELAKNAFAQMPFSVVVIRYQENPSFAAEALLSAHWVMDGIYGFGFRGKPDEATAEIISVLSSCSAKVISLDLPSGLPANSGVPEGPCVKADYTASFSALKPAQVLSSGSAFCGEVTVAPVGIPYDFIEAFPDGMNCLNEKEFAEKLPLRKADGNKGTFGSALCICGSKGMAGAAIMAGAAALRCGAGLITMALPEEIYPIVASQLTEPVYAFYRKDDFSALHSALQKASSVLIGCGLGQSELALKLLSFVWENAECPMILDADGINLLASHHEILSERKAPLIITPHPKELSRLLGVSVADIQKNRPKAARDAACRFSCYVVLKGNGTVIASPEGELFFNLTGNDGMAKGGSGDVLAGMLASFAAQKMPLLDVCITGVYFHGLAGDFCAKELSRRAMLPTDLIKALPKIFSEIEQA